MPLRPPASAIVCRKIHQIDRSAVSDDSVAYSNRDAWLRAAAGWEAEGNWVASRNFFVGEQYKRGMSVSVFPALPDKNRFRRNMMGVIGGTSAG